MIVSEARSLEISPPWFATLFRTIWRTVVWRQHELGVLNSERALQGHLVGALSAFAPDLVTLVEPTIDPASGIKPDLWIGHRDRSTALAIVELKYVPHHYPEWEKDLASLTTVLATGTTAYDTHPATGHNSGRLSCTPETLGIFAVVGRHDADAVNSALLAEKVATSDLPAQQRSALSRILHAWGTVDVNASKRVFDANWLRPTEHVDFAVGPAR